MPNEQIVSASAETFDEITLMQRTIDEIEQKISDLITKGNQLADPSISGWSGPDADRWRTDWTDETSPKLTQTLTVLRSINANAKDSASNIMNAGGNFNFG